MALRNVRVFISILVIGVAAACGGGEAPSDPMSAAPTGPAPAPVDPGDRRERHRHGGARRHAA